MQPLGFVQLQGTGHGAEDLVGNAADVPFLKPDVPLGTHSSKDGNLFPPQARHAPPTATPLEPRLLRGDLRAPRAQELADLGSAVHTTNVTSGQRRKGG